MSSGESSTYLEYIYDQKDCIKVFSLQFHYENYNKPVCLIRNQYGFFQEVRFDIEACEQDLDSMQAPHFFYNTLAFSPHYIANFELGEFLYPILLRPFIFHSKYYNHYLQLFYFYMIVPVSREPYYCINIPFHYIDKDEGKDYYFIFIYKHPICYNIMPIDYYWSLYKIFLPISTNQCILQIQVHQKFKDLIKGFFENTLTTKTNNLSTRELMPAALLSHFECNYTYRFGYNFGINGVFPSNNGFSDGICISDNNTI